MNLMRVHNNKNNDYAEFSEDDLYRYVLKRKIEIPYVCGGAKPMLFIMLNPSTATEVNNDPTVRRCVSFAERELCPELYVVNLFALRSSDPKLLSHTRKDPIGPFNNEILKNMINWIKSENGLIVAAWGANAIARGPGEELTKKFGPFLCLGTTKHGAPRHPLYVKSNQLLETYK